MSSAAKAIGRRWKRLVSCCAMVLAGLSASPAWAQSTVPAPGIGGPTLPGNANANRAPAETDTYDPHGQAPHSGPPPTFHGPPATLHEIAPRIRFVPKSRHELEVIQHRSQLINTNDRVRRIHIADPAILEVIQFSEFEFALMGVGLGTTDLTFWFEGTPDPSLYVAHVIPDPALEDQRRLDYGKIERKLALLYPNSKVYLIPMSRKIIVRGQAKDAEEAARIMQIVRGEALTQDGDIFAGYQGPAGAGVVQAGGLGAAGAGYGGAYGGLFGGDLLSSFIVNELEVPGEFQVMLRVRIAELNRSQLRRAGIDWQVIWDDARNVVTQTFATAAPVLTGLFENGEITVLLDALASNGSAKILEDSVVVTMSGNPASFLSGGEFAVPNTVGNNGVLVGTTTFRGFGTSIIATPTVIDDDLIRLQIIPELSAINAANSVGGVPGVDVRRVQTSVELREGQTIVLGGLFSRRQQAEVTRIPFLGEIPVIGTHLFNTRQATEDETEMLIVVTPEIVRPMDAEEVPPLPGFYVTHPDDFDLYKLNRTEGNPDLSHYRLLPYGNGNGYGENAGFGYHNPDYGPSGLMGPETDGPPIEYTPPMEHTTPAGPFQQPPVGDHYQPPIGHGDVINRDGEVMNAYPVPQSSEEPHPAAATIGRPRHAIQQMNAKAPAPPSTQRRRYQRWK